MSRRILLVRHGQSTWNALGRWQGWADPPLSALGEAQAAEAAAQLAVIEPLAFTSVVASDLQRAQRTAAIISAALGLGAVHTEADLRERNVGEWSGLTRVEIQARWPEEMAAWIAGRIEATPGGEPEGAFTDRVVGALVRSAEALPTGDVLVVSHGGVARALDRALGVESVPVGNLAGRWYEFDGNGGPVAGSVVNLAAPDHRTQSPSV